MAKLITITARLTGSRELQYITERGGVMPLCNMLDKNVEVIEFLVCDGQYMLSPEDFVTDFCTHLKWVKEFDYTRQQ